MECESPMDEQEAKEREIRVRFESLRSEYNANAEETGDASFSFDDFVESRIEHDRAAYQKERASKELHQSFARWDKITATDTDSLCELLASDPAESGMHTFLEANPKFLVQVLTGGHGRYQLSKVRLGSEYVPDFLIAEETSIGIEWYAVEIESPKGKMHRKDGLPAEGLNHALGQIRDWRKWLMNNLDYARRPREQDGLGLIGIDSRVPGLIIMGRRCEYPERFNEFRRQIIDRERITIHSYDWMLDVARSNRSSWLRGELG